ncbi:alpha-amylase family glycosyl hydrolase [Alkalibacterium sp. MB6]|uniref:alpha-amylase family glycosyl hydrolase n=1 Tax=Alkalibacterium sp. MB6 TaxID=2081965 RepID=UPI00137A9F23|nr:alpha-amylase family glycosyl hydrolase [Alkalibacterium sp. MB6]
MIKRNHPLLMGLLAALLLFQSLAQVFPVFATVTAATERVLRVHLETDSIDNGLSLWAFGDVLAPSESVGEWPDGIPFTEEQQTDFGYYIDVELNADAVDVGFVAVYEDESRYIQENIEFQVDSDTNEVWIQRDGSVSFERPTNTEPVETEERVIRVHYLNEEANYEDYGVWFWGAPNQPQVWPSDAISFSNEQVGENGAFVEIPVGENPSSFGFLIVYTGEVAEGENRFQTGNLMFASFDEQQDVYVTSENHDMAFLDPDYQKPTVESEEEPEEPETEGEADITVTASVNRPFNYNEHALLDVQIANESDLSISRIRADLTAIGGPPNLGISPELNRVTLSVDHTVQPGTYSIPITVVDELNGSYTAQAEVTITARNKTAGERDWDEEIIYFMLTDRFADGDPSNNNPYGLDYEGAGNQRGVYQGGDFKGVTQNLDYLEDLGITTIWITPIVENVGQDVGTAEAGEYYGYHGYWAKSFEKLNPHLGTLAEFHELIDAAAAKDINIMVDVVLNHAGYGMHPKDNGTSPSEGFPTDSDRAHFDGMIRENSGNNDRTMELAGLPDFETERHEVREQLVEWQANWVEKSTTPNGNAIASYRVDTVKHVDTTTWQHFKNELVERDPSFKLIGESWGANYRDNHGYLNNGTMDSLLDFGFKDIANLFLNGRIVEANNQLIERNAVLSSDATLGQFLGSHDEPGFLFNRGMDNTGELKLAASLQMTAKGQPVIYYGEELGQSGALNWPQYDNRYDLDWSAVEDNDILDHYQSVIAFRNDFSDILSRGNRSTFLTSSDQDWIMVERALADESVYMAFNLSDEEQTIAVETSNDQVVLTDHYSNTTYTALEQDGETSLTFTIPSLEDGGTALLTVEEGELVSSEVDVPTDSEEPQDGESPKETEDNSDNDGDTANDNNDRPNNTDESSGEDTPTEDRSVSDNDLPGEGDSSIDDKESEEESSETLPSTATLIGSIGLMGIAALGLGVGLTYYNKKKKD